MKSLLLSVALIFLIFTSSQAQKKTINPEIARLEQENNELRESNTKFRNWVVALKDSLKNQANKVTTDQMEVNQLANEISALQKKVEENKKKEKESANIEELKYELNLLQNSRVARVYDVKLDIVEGFVLSKLKNKRLDFQWSKDSLANAYKLIKIYDSGSDISMKVEKSTEIKVEMSLNFEKHQFNDKRTVLYLSSMVFEKSKVLDNVFVIVNDEEKSRFYRDKTLKILDADFRESVK